MIIDDSLKEMIIDSRGNKIDFHQLSNGQKFRLTFSLIFAFLKFQEVKNAVSTNLLFADEVLDTSLDSEGRDDLIKILKYEFVERNNKNVFIISHNPEIKEKEELFDEIYEIQRKNKFSTVSINNYK